MYWKVAFILLLISCASATEIALVSIKGEVTEGTYITIEHAYAFAKLNNFELILVEIDTPGGLLSSTQKIVSLFMNSEIPIVVFVDSGSMCASAGTVILLSAHIAVLANGTSIGAATPVSTISAVENKTVKYIASYVKDIAKTRGRNADIAEKFVTEALSLGAEEAYRLNVIDMLVENREELFKKLNGMKVKIDSREIVIDTSHYRIVEIEKPLQAKLYEVISNPQIAVILLLLGVYLLIFGLTSPGTLAEVVGAILLILAFAGLGVININYAGIFLIIIGILFLIAELLTPTYGVLGAASVIAITIGALMIFEEPMMPKEFYEFFPKLVIGLGLGIASFMTFALIKILRAKRRKSEVGEVVGSIGEIIEFKNGKGYAKVRGEIWSVESAENLNIGDEIIVLEREGLRLRVKKVDRTQKRD